MTTPKRDGGQAFPSLSENFKDQLPGMSLRDYFAAASLIGMRSAGAGGSAAAIAADAYALADAMLAEKEKAKP